MCKESKTTTNPDQFADWLNGASHGDLLLLELTSNAETSWGGRSLISDLINYTHGVEMDDVDRVHYQSVLNRPLEKDEMKSVDVTLFIKDGFEPRRWLKCLRRTSYIKSLTLVKAAAMESAA